MRKLYILIIGLMMMFSLSSCETYTYATTQDDIYTETEVDIVRSNVSFDVIIQYGTPYYRDGSLLYYIYRDIYYYPFYYNNYWYVRAYRRPFTHFDRRPYFRPHRYDYRFSPGYYRGFNRPDRHIPDYRYNPNIRPSHPNIGNHRHEQPRVNGHRPQRPSQIRPNIRSNQLRFDKNQNNHRNFGERR